MFAATDVDGHWWHQCTLREGWVVDWRPVTPAPLASHHGVEDLHLYRRRGVFDPSWETVDPVGDRWPLPPWDCGGLFGSRSDVLPGVVGQVVAGFGPARRTLAFRSGLMAGVPTLSTSDLWPDDLVGHSGLAGMTLVAGSRAAEMSFAIHLNGMMSPEVGDGFVRPLLTASLHSDLSAAGFL